VFHTRPFVRGTTLRAWIGNNGAVPLARAVEILRGVLQGLAHAHAAGVAHGEVKPENVILAPATPLRSSSRLPLSRTEFLTVFPRRFVCTFALSDSDDGMFTMDWASIVPGAFSAAPFAVHGVTTARQTKLPARVALVTMPALSVSFVSISRRPVGARVPGAAWSYGFARHNTSLAELKGTSSPVVRST